MSGTGPCLFVKWAGGKRSLLKEIRERLPGSFGTYWEPFLGGGALLLSLRPGKARVNDANPVLAHVWRTVRDDPEGLVREALELDAPLIHAEDRKAYYLSVRAEFNARIREGYDTRTAAAFLFLNRHCFNGVWRVNRQGGFNVPYNGSLAASADPGNIRAVSRYLREADVGIGSLDFADAVQGAGSGDFVFLDSPYAPLKEGSFVGYTEGGFGAIDHMRVAAVFRELDKKGVLVMATNHDTGFVREAYRRFRIDSVTVRGSVNRDGNARTRPEVIIRNY